jgi:hypothetical protein
VVAGVPSSGGDALRLADEGPYEARADDAAELLVWSFG